MKTLLYSNTYTTCHVVQSHDKLTQNLMQQRQQLKNRDVKDKVKRGIGKGKVTYTKFINSIDI